MKFFLAAILALAMNVSISEGRASQEICLISHAGSADPFWKAEFDGAKHAAREAGVGLKILTPKVPNDIVRQIALLRSAIGKNPAGIALTISDANMFSTLLKKARQKGIPVIAFNVRPKDDDREKNPHLAYIGIDDHKAGRLAAERAVASGRIGRRVLVPMHQPGIPGLEARYRGIREILSAEGIATDKVDTTTDSRTISTVVLQYLGENPDVRAVFCLGAATFHAIGNLEKEHRFGIYLCGFDTSSLISSFIRDGLADFTIDQQPYLQGYLAVKLLALADRFKMSPPDVDTVGGILDKAHLKSVKATLPGTAPENLFFVSHAGMGDPFWKVEFNGARDAAKEVGVNLAILAPETSNDVTRQIELLNSAIESDPAGIATTVSDTGMFSKALKTARKKGIPTVAVNTRPVEDDRKRNPYLAYFGMNDYLAGKVAGRHALASGKIRGRVAVAMHQTGHAGLEARYLGIAEILTPKGIRVDKLHMNTDPDRIRKTVREYLENHADTGAVFCLGPSVLHIVGRLVGKMNPDIYICSFDISPLTLELIKSGVVDFTIDQQPYMQSYLAVQLLALKARFNISPPDVNTGVGIIDISNAAAVENHANQGTR